MNSAFEWDSLISSLAQFLMIVIVASIIVVLISSTLKSVYNHWKKR